MFQLTYTKTPSKKHVAYGESWTHTVAPPPPAFMEEYRRLSPAMAYNARYGFKQSNTDSYADAQTRAEFESELDKKVAANYAGTINERGTVTVVEKKTELESMVETIAAENVDRDGKTRTKAERAALIDLYLRIRRVDLTKEAETRLAANKENAAAVDPAILAQLQAMGLVPVDPVESPATVVPMKGGKK